jgi:hypothetical protein
VWVANVALTERQAMATIAYDRSVGGASLTLTADSVVRRMFSVLLPLTGAPAVIALLIYGKPAALVGLLGMGAGALNVLRLLNKYTEFRADSVIHRDKWLVTTVPTNLVKRTWFYYGGGTVALLLTDGSVTMLVVEERAIGSDQATRRAGVARLLVETVAGPYVGTTTADPPPGEPMHRVTPLSRRQTSFARLLAAEWGVIAATIVATLYVVIPRNG